MMVNQTINQSLHPFTLVVSESEAHAAVTIILYYIITLFYIYSSTLVTVQYCFCIQLCREMQDHQEIVQQLPRCPRED